MGRSDVVRAAVAAAATATAALTCGLAPAAHAGLPEVGTGARPGPAILYAPPPRAPQLENVAPWRAEPILVSGAAAYRRGEFLYQDFLFDDHGARGVPDPGGPQGLVDFLFSPSAGSLTYPRDPVFANNAADLVELRVKPIADATAFRVTLNSLKDPERTAFTIAIGASDELRAWPHGAGVRSPAQLFLTVHGTTAELRDAANGAVLAPAPAATVDLERRQVEVRVPRGAWDPGRSVVRLAAGVGLWDVGAGRYLQPRLLTATADRPGGGSPLGAALFNVAFRFSEPLPDITQFGLGVTIGDAAAGGLVDAAWWRERSQSEALLLGDVSRFHADVDFAKLHDTVDDEWRVPRTGVLNRILASRLAFGQGFDPDELCGGLVGSGNAGCKGGFVGQLQPYTLYVPEQGPPKGGYGLDLLLHSLSGNYNQYSASKNQSQLALRGPLSLVATPNGRGPDGGYRNVAEADTFEVWADVARHYPVDPGRATVSGYSMGGFGTFQLLARWPDLFARGQSTVGAARDVATIPSLRNTPIMSWAAVADELVNVLMTEETTKALADARVRFDHFLFPLADHLTLATTDEYGPAADFLAGDRVDRDPPHLTYVVAPGEDFPDAQVVADHVSWLSGLRARDGVGHATIDARSEGFGVGEAPVGEVAQSTGTLEGGSRGPTPYLRRSRSWGEAPATPKADRLVVRAKGLAAATVDARRAKLSCAPALDVQADDGFDLRVSCPPVRRKRCSSTLRLSVPRVKGRRVVRVVVTRNGKVVKRARGRDVRRVAVRRPSRKAFALRLRVTTTSKGKRGPRRVSVLRRYKACG